MSDSIFTKIINGDIPCHKILENEHFISFLDINPIKELDSGSGEMFVVDNSASKGDICGSVSWQLYDGYKELNIRLVLTFDVPWK